ncbi:sigma-70 family RNA polymerase sigma factor [Clostridium sp. ZBS2]|uniref:sigma-70 family RNA polymerase sigma factor n=1 Tax=Clostridium sp. ZBS2 TaxID=2949976 RepID=UPI002079B0CC|nr:sigma-70 family RNA polymerase sigma factor [Clostridium sp. ZBS2]
MDCYTPLIYTIVSNKILGIYSKEDIEECVSDVFMEIFNNRNRIDLNKGSIKGFLATIAKRKAIDMYRRKDANKSLFSISMDNVCCSSHRDDVINLVSKKEEYSKLIDTIKALGEPDSEIIIRKYYLNQSSKEISKDINLKVNAIDKKVSRCIKKLKKMLGGIL